MIHFLSFGDAKMRPSLKRIKSEAEQTGWFDTITVVDQSYFDKEYMKLVRPTLHMRGFGYMRWKSYVVRRKLYEICENDILIFSDAGCTLNPCGGGRFQEYIRYVNDIESGLLFFVQEGLKERAWTKMDLLDYVGYKENTDQLWSGLFMVRKTPQAMQFAEQWYDLCNNHFNLITDTPSKLPNDPSFVENRHDQSALSVIGKKYNPQIVSANETYTTRDFATDLQDFPFWATRKRQFSWWGLKKMGLKKRFPKLFGKLY